MRKLDRLTWVEELSFSSYGLRIGVRTNQWGLLDLVKPHLPPGWRSAPSSRVQYLYSLQAADPAAAPPLCHRLYGNSRQLARSDDLEALLAAFGSHVQLFIAEWARRRVFIHAGVVGWRGQAILIPGRSFSGKSTLVAAMVRAGAAYYSDEYAVLDAHGRVHPYPRRLSLREAGRPWPRQCGPEDLGGRAGSRPLPVGLIVVTKYRPGALWRPRTMTAGRAVLALLQHTVPTLRKPAAVLDVLQQVVSSAPALEGTRGEAEEWVELLFRQLDNQPKARS